MSDRNLDHVSSITETGLLFIGKLGHVPFLFGSSPLTHCSRSVHHDWWRLRTQSPSFGSTVIVLLGLGHPWCVLLSPSQPAATREGCCSGVERAEETFLDLRKNINTEEQRQKTRTANRYTGYTESECALKGVFPSLGIVMISRAEGRDHDIIWLEIHKSWREFFWN